MASYGVSDEITKNMDPDMVAARIFIGNLPSDGLSRDQFAQRFMRYGRVLGVAIKKGFGFVQFSEFQEAQRAAVQEAGALFNGNKIDVRLATENRKRGGGADGAGVGGPRPRLDEFRNRSIGAPAPPIQSRPGPRLPPPHHQMPQPSHSPPTGSRSQPMQSPARQAPAPSFSDPAFRSPDPAEPQSAPRRSGNGSGGEAGQGRPYDAVLLALSPDLRPYAEMLERRLLEMNLSVDVLFSLGGEEKVSGIVEAFAARGLLYVLVLTPQHAHHKSLTLNILHGSPQEHRNMPLEDALSLLGTDFGEYVGKLRLGAEQPSLSFLLHLLADGRSLSVPELDRVLAHLSDRRCLLLGNGATQPPALPQPTLPTHPQHQPTYLQKTEGQHAVKSVEEMGGYEGRQESVPVSAAAVAAINAPSLSGAERVSQHVLAALGAKGPSYPPPPTAAPMVPEPSDLSRVVQGLNQGGSAGAPPTSVPSSAQINKTLNALLKNPDALRSLGLGSLTPTSLGQPGLQQPLHPTLSVQSLSQPPMSQQGLGPQQALPQQNLGHQGLSQQGLPQQGIPQQGLSQQGLSQQGLPQQGLSQQGLSQQGIPHPGLSQANLSGPGQVPPQQQMHQQHQFYQHHQPPPPQYQWNQRLS